VLKPFLKQSYRALSKRQDLDSACVNSITDPTGIRVLITGGYGYQNVGDEAQLGANLDRWRKLCPGVRLLVLSPNPSYTAEHHSVDAQVAPRVVWFQADSTSDYSSSNERFQKKFWSIRRRMLWAAKFARTGLPVPFISKAEAKLLKTIAHSDVLHISGGGFLTGMTRSRLWENSLLMQLCYLLGTPVILSGQTIGVFKSTEDRKLARLGLEHAQLIYLRDRGSSERDVSELGIEGSHVVSTFDDALFCARADQKAVSSVLSVHGLENGRPIVVVNYHYWGMSAELQKQSRKRFAEICDYLVSKKGVDLLFIPMIPSDEEAERAVIDEMVQPATLLKYDYNYRIARGIMATALFVLTMKHHPIIFGQGECVPSISIAFDDYYFRKNYGAMANCGHERLCLNSKTFFGRDIFSEMDHIIDAQDFLRAGLREYIASTHPRANAVIERFVLNLRENAKHNAQ